MCSFAVCACWAVRFWRPRGRFGWAAFAAFCTAFAAFSAKTALMATCASGCASSYTCVSFQASVARRLGAAPGGLIPGLGDGNFVEGEAYEEAVDFSRSKWRRQTCSNCTSLDEQLEKLRFICAGRQAETPLALKEGCYARSFFW